MKLTNEVRMAVIEELMAELDAFGHYQAVTHVSNCRKRLQARMENVSEIRHKASAETANGERRQVAQAT